MEKSLNFETDSISVSGMFEDSIEYPNQACVIMPEPLWIKIIKTLNDIPFNDITMDINHLSEVNYFFGKDKEFDLYDLEDPLEFRCFRLRKPFSEYPTLNLVIQAKYHDTFISYELSMI